MESVTDWLPRIGRWGSTLLPVLIVVCLCGGAIWYLMRRRRQRMEQHEAATGLGPASFFQNGHLPVQYDFVAQFGTRGPASATLGEKTLRPSFGVKLVVVWISGMVVYYALTPGIWQAAFALPDTDSDWIFTAARFLLPLVALNAILYVLTSEARYDRDVLIVTRFLRRREYRWKHLTRLADDGAYDLVLFFAEGGRAKVLKHSTGIREFKDFALAQVRKNRISNA